MNRQNTLSTEHPNRRYSKSIGFRVSPALYDKLQKAADKKEMSLGQLVRLACLEMVQKKKS